MVASIQERPCVNTVFFREKNERPVGKGDAVGCQTVVCREPHKDIGS